MVLYKHKDSLTIAAMVVKFIHIPDKDYVKIKVRWYSLHPRGPMDMGIETWLTTETSIGTSTRQRRKYPLKRWTEDWRVI